MTGAFETLFANPILSALTAADRERFAAVAHLRRFDPGDLVIRQGDRPDGAYFIVEGEVYVTNLLPGGGETPIATLGPGEIVGELALLHPGKRIASVRAAKPTRTAFLSRRYFMASCDQLEPFAFDMVQSILAALSARFRAHLEREIAETLAHPIEGWPEPGNAGRPALAPLDPPPFDPGAFLPRLPGYSSYQAGDLARLVAAAKPLAAPRGAGVAESGAVPEHLFIVLRGALEGVCTGRGLCHRLALFGPGRIVFIPSAIDGGPHAFTCRARETSVLLALRLERYRELMAMGDSLALSLWLTMGAGLVHDFQRANDNLSRLAGLWRRPAAESDAPAA